MTFPRFLGVVAAMVFGAIVLIWIFVSLAALVHALTQSDGQAAGIYTLFVAVGVAVAALSWWLGRRVVRAHAARQ